MAVSPVKYKILVVDDSRIFREAVRTALKSEPDMETVAFLGSGQEAIEYIKKNPVDVVTLDVEMPAPDGLQTLCRIQELFPSLPETSRPGIIMVSSFTQKGADITVKALQNGAFDFISKPVGTDKSVNLETLRRQLLVKIRCLVSKRNLGFWHKADSSGLSLPASKSDVSTAPYAGNKVETSLTVDDEHSAELAGDLPLKNVRAIVIGVSTGGPKALNVLVPQLCRFDLPPVVIVQHMPAEFTASLASSLSNHCSRPVYEAKDGQEAERGHFYIAPGGLHLVLRKIHDGRLILSTNEQPPENGCRPSVDVLFRSAAVAVAGQSLALVLTGMGDDGARGLAPLKRAGAYVIAQDEETSVVWGMPGSAVRSGLVDKVLPLESIADVVGKICM